MIKASGLQRARDHAPTKKEFEDMVKESKNFYEEFALITLAHTGMRVGEFIQLRKNWFYKHEKKMEIPKEDTKLPKEKKETGTLKKWKPKTRKGARTIHLFSNKSIRKLENFFDTHEAVAEKWKQRSSIYHLVTRISKRANTRKKVYPHALRAYFANRIIDNGVNNIRDLTTLMGWSSYDVAEAYLEGRSENTKEIAKKVRNKGTF